MTRLSEHFTVEEAIRSDVATRLGKPITASVAVLRDMERLAVLVLEPIRQRIQRKIRVTSWYRPVWLNIAVGGSPTSDHCYARAADIEADDMTPLQLALVIVELLPVLPIKQLILEFPPTGWVHVSIAEAGVAAKREVLIARKVASRTTYTTGLESPA